MRALRNILGDLLVQFRVRGSLPSRAALVLSYNVRYGFARLAGLSRDDARRRALGQLGKRGAYRIDSVNWPKTMKMEMDLYAATYLLPEIDWDSTYDKVTGFRPMKGWTVVDVGAHQGIYTFYAASHIGTTGRIVAVEPMPSNLALLKRNIESNDLPRIDVVASAALDREGQAALSYPELTTVGSFVFSDDREPMVTIQVPIRTLDEILKSLGVEKVDLVKIDVEGACHGVLLGAPNLLKQRPRFVMEVEGADEEVQKIRAFMLERGYKISRDGAILYAEP